MVNEIPIVQLSRGDA